MTIFNNKGVFSGLVSTIVVSGMIILSGNGIAKTKLIQVSQNKTVDLKKPVIAPPLGPFLNKNSYQAGLKPPAAPNAPIQPSYEAARSNMDLVKIPVGQKDDVKVAMKKPEMPSKPLFSIDSKLLTAPTMINKIANAPVSGKMPVSTIKQPKNNTLPPILMPNNIPIWMQGSRMDSPLKWNYQMPMQAPNLNQNNPLEIRYIPVPLLPAGFTIPQMSNYWMSTPEGRLNTPTPNK